MRARAYKQAYTDEWFDLTGWPFHKISCCDCGKVHLIEFRKTKKGWQMKASTDHRATAQRRRHNDYVCKPR